jgi:hypothetical protein
MTGWFLAIFFGVALVIGVYFTWVLLRAEMEGKPKAPPIGDDFGFAPIPETPPRPRVGFLRPRRPKPPARQH